ncbi:MAG: hypothetical protein ACKOV8_01425, partial [Phycisphaerales bacterium]
MRRGPGSSGRGKLIEPRLRDRRRQRIHRDGARRRPCPHRGPPSREHVAHILSERFTGTVMQRPPAFSAM